MARKAAPPKKRRRRWGAWIALALAVVLAAFVGWMALCARTVHVRRAEVALSDLPASMDGTTLLFLSDFSLCGSNTPAQAAKLVNRLQSLHPDALLLNGDFAAPSLMDRLNGRSEADESNLAPLMAALSDFRAPMGKFAVSGERDGAAESLALRLSPGGVTLLDGQIAVLTNGTDAIGVAGVGANTKDVSALSRQVRGAQCVIALMHSPAQAVDVRISEASDGGAWADLMLSGHTLGGQIRLFGRTLTQLTDAEKKAVSGWRTDGGAPLLTSQGLGCEGLNLRLGTQAEAWLITLRVKAEPTGMTFGPAN